MTALDGSPTIQVLVRIPPSREPERRYVWQVLLAEGLGFHVRFEVSPDPDTRLVLSGASTEIVVPDRLFAFDHRRWLEAESMPGTPVRRLRLPDWVPACDRDVVAIYGCPGETSAAVVETDGEVRFQFDLAGSAFFMLTRYEEGIQGGRKDAHGRMPSGAMLAVSEGFADRAVVNEYLVLLKACVSRVLPGSDFRRRRYSVMVSHDVDSALFSNDATTSSAVHALAGDIIHRRSPSLAVRRLAAFAAKGSRWGTAIDPYNTFDFLMDQVEKRGDRTAFYFICGGESGLDGNYSMDSPWMADLLRRILDRGHEVGLHPSYRSSEQQGAIAAELAELRRGLSLAARSQPSFGGRQHYLKWNHSTWREWEAAGLKYDSTIGFADTSGFRAGYCFEYSTFDLAARRHLNLKERPLIVMEKTVFPDRPGSRSLEAVVARCEALAGVCRRFQGNFTLLWHNSKVASRAQKFAFSEVLRAI